MHVELCTEKGSRSGQYFIFVSAFFKKINQWYFIQKKIRQRSADCIDDAVPLVAKECPGELFKEKKDFNVCFADVREC